MPAELALNHLNIPARDPERLRAWYVEKLGFRAHGRFLWSGGTLLVFVEGDPLPGAKMHFGFRVESLEALEGWARRLEATVEGDAQYATFYLRDPEGNAFEIFHEPVPGVQK